MKILAGDPITQSEDILKQNIETLKSLFRRFNNLTQR